jgi:hypothetical protein
LLLRRPNPVPTELRLGTLPFEVDGYVAPTIAARTRETARP